MNVVIVESPAKAKTINKYLGKGYKVLASYGHVRDLPAKDGSVRPDEGFAITAMVEKPKVEDAPSNLIISGRYILQPEIFSLIAEQPRGAGGEIQITDAMITLAKTQPFYGLKFEGRSFDCGSKIGFLTANIAYALERPDLAPALRAEIKQLLGD